MDEFDIQSLKSHDNMQGQVMDRINEFDGQLNININANRELFSKANKLKIIANYGVGYDNIDIHAAKERGIAVSNTPNSTTNPTANHAMALMLSLMRKVAEHDRKIKSRSLKSWYGRKVLGTGIEGKTLGIIGMGRIGKAVAKRALSFGMNIIYFNRNQMEIGEETKYNASYKDLESLLGQSDVISIHTPLSDKTKGLIGKEELKLMKPSSFLINTARGGVVNESAIIECLKDQTIAGAAFDVFENEPNPRSEFFDLENFIITPHNGTGTHEARDAMMHEAMGNIVAFLKDEKMTSRII